MFKLERLVLGFAALAFLLSACEKFDQSPRASAPEMIIIVDPGLGTNSVLPTENIQSVVTMKLTVKEAEEEIVPFATAAFLGKPVSGIDPRVIAGDLPYGYYYTKNAKKFEEKKTKEGATPKERRSVTNFTAAPSEIEYTDTFKVLDLGFKFNVDENVTFSDEFFDPSTMFKLQFDDKHKILKLKQAETIPFDVEEIKAKFNGRAMEKLSLKTVKTEDDSSVTRASLSLKSSTTSASGFRLPKQHFIDDGVSTPEPTYMGALGTVKTPEGFTINWLKNYDPKTDGNSFIDIRIEFIDGQYNGYQNDNRHNPYTKAVYITTADDGERIITKDEFENKLKIKEGDELNVRVFVYRTTWEEFAKEGTAEGAKNLVITSTGVTGTATFKGPEKPTKKKK